MTTDAPSTPHPNNRNLQSNRRVADAIAMRIEARGCTPDSSPLSSQPTHVVQISGAGLEFKHEKRLPTNEDIILTLCLGPEQRAVSLQAQVVSSNEVKGDRGNKCFDARVVFTEVDQQARMLLDQHIEHILERTSSNCRVYNYAS
ncbi:hypothetical protein AB833_23600 [Chromatiales bacterium (ex Bugula neritina AB1)]|nr:hypothetical protein AB833_23600 [Chromatiales bacterium (ex Bugula neritina AB1)]